MFLSKRLEQRLNKQDNLLKGINHEMIEQNNLIKKQNKRLRKIQNSVELISNRLDVLSELINPTYIETDSREKHQRLKEIQDALDSRAGQVIDQPVGS